MYWSTMEGKKTKIGQLRNNEYYYMQELFDELHKRSRRKDMFYELMKHVTNQRNLRLAYRNIKNNKGSKTAGISGKSMTYIANMKLKDYLKRITQTIMNYKPPMIKRVGIPKTNGKIRQLGIMEPLEKVIEQAILQVLTPIVNAKFHNNSNGFIQQRGCHRAISQMTHYINKEKLYFVVDIDIKGFFDNINHGKLLKQLWTLGIRDKNLLSIISKMLKAEVRDVGVSEKGIPQGGILSPLLANVNLNEFDWWLESKASLGIRFVRYADDFKILCPTYSIAKNMLGATEKWLSARLKLEVSNEKTKIVNLKRCNSTFLGFRFKLKKKKKKWKIVSNMTDKAIENTKEKLKSQIRIVKKEVSKKSLDKEIDVYNSTVIGIQNYYCIASNITTNLNKTDWIIGRYITQNFKGVLTFDDGVEKNNFVSKNYGKNRKLPFIRGKPVAIIGEVKHKKPSSKNQGNYYEEEARIKFYDHLKIINLYVLEHILSRPYRNETLEFNDNVLSKFCGQYGKYAFTNKMIINIENMKVIKIKNVPFNNKYDNIMLVENRIEKLITKKEVDDFVEINQLKKGLTSVQLKKINIIRKENNLLSILV